MTDADLGAGDVPCEASRRDGSTTAVPPPVCPAGAIAANRDQLHRRDLPGRPVWVRRCGHCGASDLRSFWARREMVEGAGWTCPQCPAARFAAHEVWFPDHP